MEWKKTIVLRGVGTSMAQAMREISLNAWWVVMPAFRWRTDSCCPAEIVSQMRRYSAEGSPTCTVRDTSKA